jgi:Tfp pilus assembly protein PilX
MVKQAQQGVTMLIVLILLSVMLLGGLALTRLTEIGVLASGNASYHEAAMQASEVGINTAYAAVKAVTNEDTAISGWYWPTSQTKDGNGLPSPDWSAAPKVTVGQMTVQYVAERACTATPVTNATLQCLIRQNPQPPMGHTQGEEQLDPLNSRQFRITVRVSGPKGSTTWVQSLVTKG